VGELLQLRELTVELPTAAGWVKPAHEPATAKEALERR
jgi:hypothetical protein